MPEPYDLTHNGTPSQTVYTRPFSRTVSACGPSFFCYFWLVLVNLAHMMTRRSWKNLWSRVAATTSPAALGQRQRVLLEVKICRYGRYSDRATYLKQFPA